MRVANVWKWMRVELAWVVCCSVWLNWWCDVRRHSLPWPCMCETDSCTPCHETDPLSVAGRSSVSWYSLEESNRQPSVSGVSLVVSYCLMWWPWDELVAIIMVLVGDVLLAVMVSVMCWWQCWCWVWWVAGEVRRVRQQKDEMNWCEKNKKEALLDHAREGMGGTANMKEERSAGKESWRCGWEWLGNRRGVITPKVM